MKALIYEIIDKIHLYKIKESLQLRKKYLKMRNILKKRRLNNTFEENLEKETTKY